MRWKLADILVRLNARSVIQGLDLSSSQRTWRNGNSGPNKVSSLSANGAVVTSTNHLYEPTPKSSPKGKDPATEALKFRYGEGQISEEVCPKCGKNFECYSKGVLTDDSGPMLR